MCVCVCVLEGVGCVCVGGAEGGGAQVWVGARVCVRTCDYGFSASRAEQQHSQAGSSQHRSGTRIHGTSLSKGISPGGLRLTCSPSGVTTATLPAAAVGADTGCSGTLHISSPVLSERALSLRGLQWQRGRPAWVL